MAEIMEEYLSSKQTAIFMNCSTEKLAKLRCRGEGVRYVKDGGKILYSKKEILKYLESRSHGSTSEYPTTPGPGRPAGEK